MNTYQSQQFWNTINSIVGFLMPIVFLSFLMTMVKSISIEEPKRYWLVYVTPEGKWGAWDISPREPTLTFHKEDPKKYLKEWGEYYYRDAEAQIQRGRFARYWISEATTRYRAIRNIQVMALPEHHNSNITTQEAKGTCYEDAWRFIIKEEEGELIHGSVQLTEEGKRIKHAWVELPTGFIYEPQTGQYFTRKNFGMLSPIEEHRYSVEEAAIMVARVGKHGPWTDEERARWLPKHRSVVIVYHGTDDFGAIQAILKTRIFKGEAGRDTFTDAIIKEDEKPYFKYNLRLKISKEYIEEFDVPPSYSLVPGIFKVYAPIKDIIPIKEAELVG